MIIKFILTNLLILSVVFFNGCGAGGSGETAIDVDLQKSNGVWYPTFSGHTLPGDWYELKLDENGSIDSNTSQNINYTFDSYGQVYFVVEAIGLSQVIGEYDVNEFGTILTIDSIYTSYEKLVDFNDSCVSVLKKTSDDENGTNYYLCKEY
jgi:hypothetical protein